MDLASRSPVSLSGSKAKGLVVLLAFAPDYSRSRIWLKKKLWSDRGEDQASSSLRQCLSELKRSLGSHSDMLVATQKNISLNVASFTFNRLENIKDPLLSSEILEDLDAIKDLEFQRWVDSLRLELNADALQKKAISENDNQRRKFLLVLEKVTSTSLVENILISELSTSLTKFIVELPDVEIVNTLDVTTNPSASQNTSGCRLLITTHSDHESVFASVSLESLYDQRVLWSDTIFIREFTAKKLESTELLALSGNIVYQLSDVMISNQHAIDNTSGSSMRLHSAINSIFCLDKTNMLEADQLLKHLYQKCAVGQILAWRAFLHSLATIQHHGSDFLPDSTHFVKIAGEAIKQSPNDSMSLLVISQYELLYHDNPGSALHFSQQGVIKNPLNSLAWAALSNAQSVTGNQKEAIVSAQRAIILGKNSPYKHYLEFFACMAHAAALSYKQAVIHAEISCAYSPEYTSPLRFLLPLYKATRQPEKYLKCLETLQKLEPDFTVERFSEIDYPITVLRSLSLMNFVR